MPIRIKPVYDLGPCILNHNGVKGICSLVDQHFNHARFTADIEVWEVYNEPLQEFLSAIESHDTLDSIKIEARDVSIDEVKGEEITKKSIELIFDRFQATLRFSAPIEEQQWFDDFFAVLIRHILSPYFQQRFLAERSKRIPNPLPVTATSSSYARDILSLIPFVGPLLSPGIIGTSKRYCYIILRKKPPNPFIENVKANLFSNLIWVVGIFILGFLFALLASWIVRNYGVNVYDWFSPPVLPTPTPVP